MERVKFFLKSQVAFCWKQIIRQKKQYVGLLIATCLIQMIFFLLTFSYS